MTTKSIEKQLKKAREQLDCAYAPYSNYAVAACIKTQSGKLYSGCNVENASYSLTVCAETSAISQMIAHGEQAIESIVIMTNTEELCSPCGACRQRINEFKLDKTQIHLCNKQSIIKTLTIEELLPLAFGPKNLLKEEQQ